jgi:hypothetical protein
MVGDKVLAELGAILAINEPWPSLYSLSGGKHMFLTRKKRVWYHWTGALNLREKLRIFYFTGKYDDYIQHHVLDCLEDMISYIECGLPLNKIPIFEQHNDTSKSLRRVVRCMGWVPDVALFDSVARDIKTLMESLLLRFASLSKKPEITWQEIELLFRFLDKAVEVEYELDPDAEALVRRVNRSTSTSSFKFAVLNYN